MLGSLELVSREFWETLKKIYKELTKYIFESIRTDMFARLIMNYDKRLLFLAAKRSPRRLLADLDTIQEMSV